MSTPPPAQPELPQGLYDRLMTVGLAESLKGLPLEPALEAIDDVAVPEVLAAHLAAIARRRLDVVAEEDRLEVVNDILERLRSPEEKVSQLRRLVSLREPERPGQERRYPASVDRPLGMPALMTNTGGEPNLRHEIRQELLSADRIDLICAFIMWPGVRELAAELASAKRREVPLRVITTTYRGCTQPDALDRLVRDFGAEVRINYEIGRTRLHAKAWLFERNTGHHTAYVGSSNLSSSAMLDGVEWNVRLTQAATPTLINKMGATFETYWNDSAFEPYDPDRDRQRLEQALLEAGGGLFQGKRRETFTLSNVEVRPFPHQQEILEQLDVEREVHGRHRNLVVAATGTGKTVIAALDYKRLADAAGRRPSLLFVAHRQEILEQALRTYREVLADNDFGELYVGGKRPEQWRHVFASVQTLKPDTVHQFDPAQFEIVVVDEFHHAAARSYEELLRHFKSTELLGLTATPERTDGIDVRKYFDNTTAAEIRLWDALRADLLCPFHYFGIDDGTDLTNVSWKQGRYDVNELENLYTGNDARARIVLSQLRDKVADASNMRALGFCVGVKHAEYMARVFNDAGIPAVALSGKSTAAERLQAPRDLAAKRINIIFVADLFNEGVDLPDVDTVLFLRPTESSTIFLQQLGRGLRRAPNKRVLTVLDFVGNQRLEFRYDVRFTAMTGIPRGYIEREASDSFPHLPPGCQIILDRQSEVRLLDSLRRQTRSAWAGVVNELRALGDVSLGEFLSATGRPLDQVLRSSGNRSWMRARIEAGLDRLTLSDATIKLLDRGPSLAHVDDVERLDAYLALLHGPRTYEELEPRQQIFARMFLFSIWPTMPFPSFSAAQAALDSDHAARREFTEILNVARARIGHVAQPLTGRLRMNPLRSHASYTREEICAALGYATIKRNPTTMRQGVFYSHEWETDALLVTLNKDASSFTPTTMYEDYAISPSLFHWQSQSITTVASPTGQRYVRQRENGNKILLFSRRSGTSEFGKGAPYLLLGEVNYVSHRGEKPISIEWSLERPMPTDHFQVAGIEAG